MKAVRDRLDGWLGFLLLLAIGCAGLLVLGIAAPGEVARASWSQMGRDGGTRIIDSPAGYVGLVSLCGVVALAALLVAAWSLRVRMAAVLLAAGAFVYAGWAAVGYSRNLARGLVGVEGRADSAVLSGAYVTQPPALLPFFVLVAAVGVLLAALYAVAWWPRRAEREHF